MHTLSTAPAEVSEIAGSGMIGLSMHAMAGMSVEIDEFAQYVEEGFTSFSAEHLRDIVAKCFSYVQLSIQFFGMNYMDKLEDVAPERHVQAMLARRTYREQAEDVHRLALRMLVERAA
jgi:hypothetical protein